MRNALITGATGGLGLALVRVFQGAGWQVRATGRSNAMASRITALGAQFVLSDLTTPNACDGLCEGQELVVHAAALSANWGPKAIFEAVNVRATAALLREAQRAGCRGFVFVSSPSIYAAMRDRIGITERDAPTEPPLNCYAETKLRAERLVLAANGVTLRTCAIRPRALVGPEDRVLLPKLAGLVRRQWIPMLRDGSALIELTDVRDAAAAILNASERIDTIGGEAFNISGGQPVSVRILVKELSRALGADPRMIRMPLWLAHTAAMWAGRRTSGKEPLLTRYALATLAFSQTFDLSKAREKLGYEVRYNALETFVQTARKST